MLARRFLRAVPAVLLASSAWAADRDTGAMRELRDDTGAIVRVPERPARIACLAPDLTEIAFAVGAGSSVVAACDPCDWPAEAKALPRLGPMIEPSIETILLVRPDLVLATGEGNPLASVERLRSLGVPVFGMRPGPGLAGISAMVRRIGDLTGHADEGAALAAAMEARLASVRASSAGLPRVRACILVWTDPLVAAGRDAYLTELADAAGADNACATGTGWPTVSRETVLLAQPDVVLLGIADPAATLGSWASGTPAMRHHAVLVLPERPFLRPSAELGRAAEQLQLMLAPLRRAP